MRPYVFSQHRHFFHFRAAQQMWSGTHIYFMLASKYWSTYKYLNAPNAPPKSFLTAEPSISNLTSENPFKYQSDEEGEEKSRKLREAAWVRIAAQRNDGKWADICYYENGKTQRLRSIWKICNYCLKHDIKFEPYIFCFRGEDKYEDIAHKCSGSSSAHSSLVYTLPYTSISLIQSTDI